jgi:putative copper export protein
MRTVYLVSVYLHIVAAASWIGGMTFFVFVVVPVLRKPGGRENAMLLVHALGTRFRALGWTALVTLVVTGVVNLTCRGYGAADFWNGNVFAGEWGARLLHKLGLVVVILITSAVHDFWIGPKATRVAREAPDSPDRERYRKLASWFGRGNFVLALAVLALAIQLVR